MPIEETYQYLSRTRLGYRNINRDENYQKRMERISDIACKVKSCGWNFEPSWRCDVNTYTKRGNQFVGIMSREERNWTVFKIIKDENFMYQRVEEIFDDRLISLRAKSFYDDFYIKEGDICTYIYYMTFANFNLMHYINFKATNYLMNNKKAIVVCLKNCVEYVKGYLDEKVEVICVSINNKILNLIVNI